jgi:HAD superfamily hydrolase (TIGR01484 family)
MSDFRNLKAVVFDLDDTLAPSKSPMDPTMASALAALLERVPVCIISGGRFEQFEAQALEHLRGDEAALSRLHLMPTCGTRYYKREHGGWVLQYAEDLTDDEKQRSIAVLEAGARELGYWAPGDWGPLIEDRGSQITYSALGQAAPVAAKMAWDPDGAKKRALWKYVSSRLPDLEVRGGGSTSIDITRKGIDKAYGIKKLQEQLDVSLDELLFFGDRLDESGNDYPVYALGVASVAVEDWHETVTFVNEFNAWWDNADAVFPLTILPPSQ